MRLFFIALRKDNKLERALKEAVMASLKVLCRMKDLKYETGELIKNSGTRTAHETRRMQAKRASHWSATFGRVNCMLEVTGMQKRHITDAMLHHTVLFKTHLFLAADKTNYEVSVPLGCNCASHARRTDTSSTPLPRSKTGIWTKMPNYYFAKMAFSCTKKLGNPSN